MTKLPAWGIDDLPEPRPLTVGNMFKVIVTALVIWDKVAPYFQLGKS